MPTVNWKGAPTKLEGPELKPGDAAPADWTVVASSDLNAMKGADAKGKARIVVSVPSLDTAVCDTEVRRFNVEAAKIPGVEVHVVSMDLPFAQKRWCAAAGIDQVKTFSDWKYRQFGQAWGVWSPDKALLARAVFVVGPDDKMRHVEYVPEVTTEPNYQAALEAARALK
jgi:thiol peroxidase